MSKPATKTFKTIAKISKKSVRFLDDCWTKGKNAYNREMKKAKKGQRKPIRSKWPYVMAVALRIAQGTNDKPHVPLAEIRRRLNKKRRDAMKESFEGRVDDILHY